MVDAVGVFPYFSPTKKGIKFFGQAVREKRKNSVKDSIGTGGGDHLYPSLRVGCRETAAMTRIHIVATTAAYAALSAFGNGGWNFKNNLEQRTAA